MNNQETLSADRGADSGAAHGSETWCGLKDDPNFVQCCCNCKHLHPVHFHCCTEPKPTDEQKKAAGIKGRCVCGVQKGWACHHPEMGGRIYDDWPQHSSGCESYDPKSPNDQAHLPPGGGGGAQNKMNELKRLEESHKEDVLYEKVKLKVIRELIDAAGEC